MIQSLAFWIVLALAVPLHWRLPPKLRAGFIALVSAGLLATVAPWVVLALLAWTPLTVWLLRREGSRLPAFVLLMLGLLGQLALFKYLPPLAPESPIGGLLVPLGLSFFTFKLMHYCVEAARGSLPPHTLSEALAWILLFPTFTAGPIERFDHFLEGREAEWRRSSTVEGLTRIAHGLIKRFVFAELLFVHLAKGGDAELMAWMGGLGAAGAWTFALRSFLAVWMDFSGYCDIAIGASRLFGLRIAENFNWPILASSPSDFWQRWHITLAAWCQSYVYMPLIGLTRSPTAAVYGTFLVMGAWHAGSAHWLLWGLWQGTGVAASMRWQRLRRRRRWRWTTHPAAGALGTVLTVLYVAAPHALTALHGHAPAGAGLRLLGRMFFLPV